MQILNAVKESTGLYDPDDENLKYPGTRLDRIEEEEDSQLPEHSQSSQMDTSFDIMASNQPLKRNKTEFDTVKPQAIFDVSDMDFSMEL